ncbi:MAG TPA: MlaD family protein [Gemmatimonadales bacterium]|nr:MlaD family protein [Gemmatimonadales bacterium]
MNLTERTSDALIGVFVVGALLVLLTAVYFTQGWNRRSWRINVTSASAEGLSKDTKVFLQGLEIGKVRSVSPMVGRSRSFSFVIELQLDQRFANDSLIEIPVGTVAEIADASLVGGKAILLQTPDGGGDRLVQPGDTIAGRPRPSPIGQIASTADSLARQVSLVLADTRRLLSTVNGTVTDVRSQVNTAGPHLQSTLAQVDAGLKHLEPTLRHASQIAATADSGLGPMQDSLTRTLAAARQLLLRLDTLTSTSSQMATENRSDIRATVAQMKFVGIQLEHFLDQVSRRPLRMITGVQPVNMDSLRAASADSSP